MKTSYPQPPSSPKILIAYYTSTGFTERIAAEIAHVVDFACDVEKIIESRPRRGWLGYLRCVYESIRKKCPPIVPADVELSDYDLVIVGTPIWAHHPASPIRTFLRDHASEIREVAFFCTYGGAGESDAFDEMSQLCGSPPITSLAITDTQIGDGSYSERLNEFVARMEKKPTGTEESTSGEAPAVVHSQKIQSIQRKQLDPVRPHLKS